MPANEERRRWLLRSAAAAVSAGLGGAGLTGCGGGSADGAAGSDPALALAADDAQPAHILAGVDSGGTGRSARYFSAMLTAVSPPVVADVEFGTSSCRFTDADGLALDESALQRGMTAEVKSTPVSVVGGVSRAEALTMRVAAQVIGPLSAIDSGGTGFTVLGQHVKLKAGTVFATATAGGAGDLAVGLVVRVWGQQDIAGAGVVATRVDLPPAAPAPGPFVLRGPLSSLDRSHGRIAIGGYDIAVPDGVALPDGLGLGDLVRARLQPGTTPVLLSLTADPLMLPNRAQVEIEGRIAATDGTQRFWLDGVRVDVDGAVVTPAGSSLLPGTEVRVRGLARDGVVVASAVQVEDAGDAITELEGSISSADPATRSFVLNGVTVSWSDATQFSGGGAALLTRGRKVHVKGPRSADRSRLQARSIQVET